MQISKSSQMLNRLSSKTGICEKPPLRSPILSCAKLLIFRKCSKYFLIFLYLRKIFSVLFLCNYVKFLKMSHLLKSFFSQMILRFLLYKKSKNAIELHLNYSVYRLLLFHRRNILNTGKAL